MAFLYLNKKGSNVFVYLMRGILFFILGLALTPALTDTTKEATSTTQLNCSNATSLSEQDKATCTSLDIMPFLFFGTVMGLAGIILAGALIK